MPLASGTRLGFYEILAPIGAGGMGEVYRAHDTKLKRDVALKVLPAAFAHDPERMARFQREAELLASLNHPNIAAIYGVEHADGPQALAMEMVEGSSPKGPLSFDEAWKIASQIADALEYAHDKGVIHRDLKPANVKVTPDGVVKLLDFGLAKAFTNQREGQAATGENSPTLTMGATEVGVVLGTAAYMSPEQARGKQVDRRADIWAFGVVLYELLAGYRMFKGEDTADTLAQVLTREPDLSRVPLRARRLLRRCLEKDPSKRLKSIGAAGELIGEEAQTEMPSAPGRLWPAAALVLALALAGTSWLAWRATRPVERPLMRLSVDLGPDAVAGDRTTAAISPDGLRIAFPVKSGLATRLLNQSQDTLLSGTENATDPFFSPDGQWIGFFAEGKMKKASVQGGAVVTLCDAPAGRGASWGADGSIIATLDSNAGVGLSRVAAGGGMPQVLTKPGERGEATHRWPQILPGGRAVLFTGSKSITNYEDASIEVLSLKTGQWKVVQHGGYFGRYLPGGYLVYIHQQTLFGVPFDLDRVEARGIPAPLLEGVEGSSINAGGQFDFSSSGTFVYLSGKSTPGDRMIGWLDSAGKPQPLLAGPGGYFDLRFSPDGKRLALSTLINNIQIYDWGRGTMTPLTFTQGNRFPVWAPDGRHIVFASKGTSLQWIRADGAGEAQPLIESKNVLNPYSFSPDGKRVAFSETNPETGFDIWTLPLDLSDPEHPKPGKPELFLRTPSNEIEPAFSPDGRWMAYSFDVSGRNEVYVRPFATGGSSGSGKWQISTGGGRFPIWSRNGRELFYEGQDNRIMVAAYIAKGDSFAADNPRPWSNTQLFDVPPAWNLDLAPDGKRFAILPRADSAAEQRGSLHVTFLLSFFDEVRRRVASGSN